MLAVEVRVQLLGEGGARAVRLAPPAGDSAALDEPWPGESCRKEGGKAWGGVASVGAAWKRMQGRTSCAT